MNTKESEANAELGLGEEFAPLLRIDITAEIIARIETW